MSCHPPGVAIFVVMADKPFGAAKDARIGSVHAAVMFSV
jgi:hypothetical protein